MKLILSTKRLFFLFLACLSSGCGASGDGNAPQARDTLVIATVVKATGNPWFNRMEEGVEDAARQLGVDAYLIGPTQFDEAQQVRMIDDLIVKGVDAICVVPNDAESVDPVLQRARQKGILVITHESPTQKNCDYNLEAINNQAFARYHVDKLVEYMGREGEFAMIVGSLTAPTHNLWADEVEAYAQQNYPGLKLVTDRIPANDQDVAYQRTEELIKAYPNLKGMIVFGSLGPPGAARALDEKGLADKIMLVGTTMPNHGAPYLKSGTLKHATLWDPQPVGFAMVYLAKHLLEGKPLAESLEIPGLGTVKVQDKALELDTMLKMTKDNVDQFGF
ncbi:MAG: substrate-binding domain-containing protein [Planctomycetales bacterium]|nr:substrate-binding domain-containing protein [Planctomycetales bacterium]NIM10153.1 substrate-binding domain-containing protein [Planctomycetales bacterium]NIN09579.1 substrate-binding domain-containing protein [Planctomycetales bacterium]NIN78702.1 substrate-binding domain-containing protein [Planctomycetales bacterium]NIO35879.1 substrate-binding domain-containing protein [Planctomycetales bacterium]